MRRATHAFCCSALGISGVLARRPGRSGGFRGLSARVTAAHVRSPVLRSVAAQVPVLGSQGHHGHGHVRRSWHHPLRMCGRPCRLPPTRPRRPHPHRLSHSTSVVPVLQGPESLPRAESTTAAAAKTSQRGSRGAQTRSRRAFTSTCCSTASAPRRTPSNMSWSGLQNLGCAGSFSGPQKKDELTP